MDTAQAAGPAEVAVFTRRQSSFDVRCILWKQFANYTSQGNLVHDGTTKRDSSTTSIDPRDQFTGVLPTE